MNKKGIGKLNESSLHSFLKYSYSGEGGGTEIAIGEYVCDGITEDGEIIEVQTGSFAPLKKKLKDLCAGNSVRLIHPVIINKHIELRDAEGVLLRKRKSPKKGNAWDLFKSLVYAPELPLLKNLTIELVMIDLVEKRVADGKGSWRRKGATIEDKTLTARHEKLILARAKDYLRFVPFKKTETFTVKSLAEKACIDTGPAGKCLYVLSRLKLVERTGKKGNAYIYRICRAPKRKNTKPE